MTRLKILIIIESFKFKKSFRLFNMTEEPTQSISSLKIFRSIVIGNHFNVVNFQYFSLVFDMLG